MGKQLREFPLPRHLTAQLPNTLPSYFSITNNKKVPTGRLVHTDRSMFS